MIRLDRISKSFGEKTVLENLSAEFSNGKTVCIVGSSGSGKTTLMKIISGLIKPDGGTVSGIDRLRASFVFQEDRLMPWLTVLENIQAVGVTDKRAAEYIKKVGLSGEENTYPPQLSGGMARRAAIARALAFSGDVFFFDEPFSGLDTDTKNRITALIKEELRGKTAFVITHDASDAAALGGEIFTVN